MPGSLIQGIVKRVRQILFALKEKEKLSLDENVLEHMLFYHGLVGSSPENERQFKDVRADIIAAINHKNTTALSIALKLSPLWWTDRLNSIFSELTSEQRNVCLELFLPKDSSDSSSPLKHEDWRVRANAALILSFLEEKKAVKQIIEALSDTTDGASLSFPYLTHALGELQTEEGRLALINLAEQSDPWLRIDVANALAYYPLSSSGTYLAKMLEKEWELNDYMSVIVARHHLPKEFLTASDARLKQAGAAMIIGIVQASEQTFSASDILNESKILDCLPLLLEQVQTNPSAINATAALTLINYLLSKSDSKSILSSNGINKYSSVPELESARQEITTKYLENDLLNNLHQQIAAAQNSPSNLASLRHSLRLIGQLKVAQAEALLTPLLHTDFPLLAEVIESLGLIAQKDSLKPLLQLANKTIDLQQRIERSKSKHPVQEEDIDQAKIYWLILKALGNFPYSDAVNYLENATADFAPDKRAQALSSLVSASHNKSNLEAALLLGLQDPSPLVQLAALEGAVKIRAENLIPVMIRLLDSRENTVSKQSYLALAQLSKQGYTRKIKELLTPKLQTEREEHKKRQIELLLQS